MWPLNLVVGAICLVFAGMYVEKEEFGWAFLEGLLAVLNFACMAILLI